MPDQVKILLIIIVGFFFLFILWAISIGVTYWDSASRRKLSGIETAAWVGLVVLIPGIGFAGYLFGRVLEAFLSSGRLGRENPNYPRRVTLLKRQIGPGQQTGTILGADLLQSPSTGFLSTQPTSAVLNQGVRKYTLTVIEGPYSGVAYILDSLPVRIGRGQEVSIPLDDDRGVSRQHAELYEEMGALRIRDLKSTHGTKVNDFSINDKSLVPGDRIRVGVSTLLVGIQEGPV